MSERESSLDGIEAYEKLIPGESTSSFQELSAKIHINRKAFFAAVLFAVILGLLVGLAIGASWFKSTTPIDFSAPDVVPQVPIAPSVHAFVNDERFSAQPPEDGRREKDWDSLLPKGLGLVQHPNFAAEESMFAAFHQLHCLYTLRRAYFSNSSSKNAKLNETLDSFDNGVERAEHVTHCFEYLRQSLMCCSDSNVEPIELMDGFPGWGFKRTCRDYEQLKTLAEQWRKNDLEGFILDVDGEV